MVKDEEEKVIPTECLRISPLTSVMSCIFDRTVIQSVLAWRGPRNTT
jgi:hypothetical protein